MENRKIRKIGLYEISVILFFLIIPIVGGIVEVLLFPSAAGIFQTLFKWFVFSGLGLRLFSAGFKQAALPSFTAKEIFNLTDGKSFVIIRELGFANICFGTIGILSFFFAEFRLAAAISGGLYLGTAGFMHFFRKRDHKTETFAMVSDLFIFVVLLILGIMNYGELRV